MQVENSTHVNAAPDRLSWVRAVRAVVLVGFLSSFLLPLLAVVGEFVSYDALGRPLTILSNCLSPFLFLQHPNPADYGAITDSPAAATFAQWALLAVVNVVLFRTGVAQRPFLSALVLAGICATLSLVAVSLFDLRFGKLFRL
jgi:hypothetical protein